MRKPSPCCRAVVALLFCLAVLLPASALAQAQPMPLAPSLFFTPDESAAIEAAVQQRALRRSPELAIQTQRDAPRRLRLGAVIRFGPDRWTIWLNGERVTPDRRPPSLRAIRVERDEVVLDWYDPRSEQLRRIALRPYQEILLETGEIRRFDPAAAETARVE